MAACVDMSGIRREHTNNTWPSITTELTMKKPTTDRQSTHKMSSTSTDGILEENLVHNQTGSSTLTARESDHCVATNDESAVDALFVLPKSVAKAVPRLYKTALAPLDLSFDHVREEPYRVTMNQASRQVIRQAAVKKSGKAQASICFVVKRPGCVLCHEQGRSLSQLLAEFQDNQVAGWAVVKEIDVDNEGLLSLYQQYFRFPFFRDPKLALYSALGDRKVGIVPNPFKCVKRYMEVRKRLKNKGIDGSIIGKGEGMILGGVMILDRAGNIRYAHEEQFSRELPVDEIRAVLRRLVEEGNSKRHGSVGSSELGPEQNGSSELDIRR